MKKIVVLLFAFIFLSVNIALAAVNINKAGKAELTSLPGVGEKKAESIIKYRKKHGQFKKFEELLKVKGIGPKMFKKLVKEISL